MEITVFGTGTVGAKDLFPVCSSTGGRLLEVTKSEGEWVKKGEPVARLDPVDLHEQLFAAEASLKKASFEIESAKRTLKGLSAQRELALITFERYEKLKAQGFAAQAEYDKARADLEAITAQVETAKAQIESARAEAARARYNASAIKQRIARLTIYAPFDGYVVSKDARRFQTIAPQQSVITIVRPGDVWVRINIDERRAGAIKPHQKAEIRLRSKAETAMSGYVARIEPKSDPVTEERIVDVAFDRLPQPFFLNEQAEATIGVGKLDNTVVVPTKVLVHGGLWIYDNGRARFKKVEVLAENGEKAAVKGVEAGVKVLVPAPRKKPLREGARIYL
ncbi:probable RND efflux membrane fusion protein [Hydrogenimonas sp.]|nr:probable RND efflux membrane fusion protein [Hydrogenimonas sp.]